MAITEDKPARRLFLVSVPRTASNLLVRILNVQNQPNVVTNEKSGYYFVDPYMGAAHKGYFTKPVSDWTPEEKDEMRSGYQQCLDTLESHSDRARREGKMVFTKEHAFWFANPANLHHTPQSDSDSNSDSPQAQVQAPFALTFPDMYSKPGTTPTFSTHNKTLFPDEYLHTWQFAFLIRHPALTWPSMYRALQGLVKLGKLGDGGANMKAAEEANMTWKWSRELYQWCVEHQQSSAANKPIILDAHDVIHHPEIMLKFCEETGLDKGALQFEWEGGFKLGHLAEPSMDLAVNFMTATLRSSSGIIKDKAPVEVDIDQEAEKWKEEFGSEDGAKLEKAVREAMVDYEYLRERRMRV